MRVLLEEVIFTDFGQFDLVDGTDGFGGDADRFFADQDNGWVGAAATGVVHVVLARRPGGSLIRVEIHDEEPPVGDWEDVVEVSFVARDVVRWEAWAGEPNGVLGVQAGSYRVRVSASGRHAGHTGEFADEVVDRYLIELWPADPKPDEIIRVCSEDAAYWNSAWGGRRSSQPLG
ncbi:MAG: hypothetical protein ACTHNQ_13845 [Microbacterium sp.]|uniref:hypothetical protein n=1 Tax=Microbacterium sp. TaxID=51671 RepID=UPI003F7D069E